MFNIVEMPVIEIAAMIIYGFVIGMLFGVVLFYVPVKTKLDTLKRNIEFDRIYGDSS